MAMLAVEMNVQATQGNTMQRVLCAVSKYEELQSKAGRPKM